MSLEQVVSSLVDRVEKRYFGKYRGIVEDNLDPKKLGRLKVRVPSLLGDEVVTGWAMPCLPYGGDPNRGMVFTPEKKTGVWVEFEQGDIERPVWVGTYYSLPEGESELPQPIDADGQDAGEGDEEATVSRKIIKTKAGHTIQFEDNDDTSMLIICEGKKKHRLLMNEEGIQLIFAENNHSIVINEDGITITTESALNIEASDDITMTGNNVTIEAGADVIIKASSNVTVEGKLIQLNP